MFPEQKGNETGIKGIEEVTQLPCLIKSPVIQSRIHHLIQQRTAIQIIHHKKYRFKVQIASVTAHGYQHLDHHTEKCRQQCGTEVGAFESYFHLPFLIFFSAATRFAATSAKAY